MAEYELPHQTCLRQSHEFLLDNMSASLDNAVDCVFASGCITVDEQEQIRYTEGGPRAKTRTFLEVMYQKDDKAFDVLMMGFKKRSPHVYKGLKRKLEENNKKSSLNSKEVQEKDERIEEL